MTVRWSNEYLGHLVGLPAAVVEKHLKMAGPTHLKVLIWWATFGNGEFDEEICSEAVGYKASECRDAINYWRLLGVLDTDETPPRKPALPALVMPQEKDKPEKDKPEKEEWEKERSIKKEPPSALKKPAALPPPANRPALPVVMQSAGTNKEFKYLLNAVADRLGRPLSPGDMEIFYYLLVTLAIPAEVIMMAVVSCQGIGKGNVRYIEKTLLSWGEDGICTAAAAEEYLRIKDRRRRSGQRLTELLKLERTTATSAMNIAADLWMEEWGMSDGLIRLAADQCVAAIGRFQTAYVGKILESWRLNKITTEEKAKEFIVPVKKTKGKPLLADAQHTSLEIDAFESAVQEYRPVYKRAKKMNG